MLYKKRCGQPDNFSEVGLRKEGRGSVVSFGVWPSRDVISMGGVAMRKASSPGAEPRQGAGQRDGSGARQA